ncbi:MAG: hypothetical protein DRP64_18035, partial [Verrucomicrobia bacterium]
MGASIDGVDRNAATVGQFDRFELTVGSPASYTNPFDPDEVDLSCEFTAPGGATTMVNGFWDGSVWKVRFAAEEIGSWSYQVSMADAASTVQAGGTFDVVASDQKGWIGESPIDPRYLSYADGSQYYGVGVSMPWLVDPQGAGFYNPYTDVMAQLEANGCNIFYYILETPWDNQLATMVSGYDRYDMTHAANIDHMVEDAESHNVAILFSIWIHGLLRDVTHPWSDNMWESDNPFNALSNCDGFFTNAQSWEYQQKLYRYIIARWGYSPAIAFWHTCVEIDGTNAINVPSSTANTPTGWNNKITDYFRDNDPFGHPTTASKSGDVYWPEGYEVTDCPHVHSYDHLDDVDGIAARIAYWSERLFKEYAKPGFIGEFGKPDHEGDLSTRFMHNGIWASLMSGSCVTPLHWWGSPVGHPEWAVISEDMFDQLLHLRSFVDAIDMAEAGFCAVNDSQITLSSPGIDSYGLQGEEVGIYWLHDATPGETHSGVAVDLAPMQPGQYRIGFYNTWTGTWSTEQTTNASPVGVLSFSCPAFAKDIAMTVRRIDSSLYGSEQLYGFDHSLEGWAVDSVYGAEPFFIYDDFEGYSSSAQLRSEWNEDMTALSIYSEILTWHSPSRSMRATYNADGYFQVWRNTGIPDRDSMSVWFKGDASNTDGLVFVRLLDSSWAAVKEFHYPGGTRVSDWIRWTLDISDVDVSQVARVSLGVYVTGVGGTDSVWFDDVEFGEEFAAQAAFESGFSESGSGGSIRIDATSTPTANWLDLKLLSPDMGAFDLSEYEGIELLVFVGQWPGDLQAIPVSVSGGAYAEGSAQPLMVGKWNRVVLSKSEIDSL